MSSEHDPTLWQTLATEGARVWAGLALLAGGAVTTLVGWTARRQITRVDAIEEREREYVTRHELAQRLDALETFMRDGFQSLREDLKGVHRRIDNMRDR